LLCRSGGPAGPALPPLPALSRPNSTSTLPLTPPGVGAPDDAPASAVYLPFTPAPPSPPEAAAVISPRSPQSLLLCRTSMLFHVTPWPLLVRIPPSATLWCLPPQRRPAVVCHLSFGFVPLRCFGELVGPRTPTLSTLPPSPDWYFQPYLLRLTLPPHPAGAFPPAPRRNDPPPHGRPSLASLAPTHWSMRPVLTQSIDIQLPPGGIRLRPPPLSASRPHLWSIAVWPFIRSMCAIPSSPTPRRRFRSRAPRRCPPPLTFPHFPSSSASLDGFQTDRFYPIPSEHGASPPSPRPSLPASL